MAKGNTWATLLHWIFVGIIMLVIIIVLFKCTKTVFSSLFSRCLKRTAMVTTMVVQASFPYENSNRERENLTICAKLKFEKYMGNLE